MSLKLEINGNYKLKRFMLPFFLSVIILSIIYLIFHFSFRKIEFTQVSSGSTANSHSFYYTSIKSLDNLKDLGINNVIDDYAYDFTNHTYIITFGYELKQIKYSEFSKPPHYNDHLDYDCIPKVQLIKSSDDSFFIYELEEKVNIDYNIHNKSDKVFIVSNK